VSSTDSSVTVRSSAITLKPTSPPTLTTPGDDRRLEHVPAGELDRGEAAALAYAVDIDADCVLLGEREARAAAARHDVQVTGAIGVLLRASADDSINLRSELDALREAGLRIVDDLYERALKMDRERQPTRSLRRTGPVGFFTTSNLNRGRATVAA